MVLKKEILLEYLILNLNGQDKNILRGKTEPKVSVLIYNKESRHSLLRVLNFSNILKREVLFLITYILQA